MSRRRARGDLGGGVVSGELYICETVTAGPTTPPHIRHLGDSGPHPSGGTDGPSLCGREVAWDVMRYFGGDEHIFAICVRCVELADVALRASGPRIAYRKRTLNEETP